MLHGFLPKLSILFYCLLSYLPFPKHHSFSLFYASAICQTWLFPKIAKWLNSLFKHVSSLEWLMNSNNKYAVKTIITYAHCTVFWPKFFFFCRKLRCKSAAFSVLWSISLFTASNLDYCSSAKICSDFTDTTTILCVFFCHYILQHRNKKEHILFACCCVLQAKNWRTERGNWTVGTHSWWQSWSWKEKHW